MGANVQYGTQYRNQNDFDHFFYTKPINNGFRINQGLIHQLI